tara:strand:+ start:108 stop:1505 length:1398 start_codon:yes stop_codon:yes gene_type:complete
MATYWNDLQVLNNIIHDIKPPPKPCVYGLKELDDIKESLDFFIDDYVKDNIKKFKDYTFEDELYNYLSSIIDDIFNHMLFDDLNIEELIKDSMNTYFWRNKNPRSYPKTFTNYHDYLSRRDKVSELLEYYKSLEQPDQKTDAWYEFRYGGLTASSIYKAFDSQANQNNLIYEKCKPLKKHTNSVNIDSAFHHGHLYEPLSTMIYEWNYDTTIGEFGCIKHKDYEFIRASPDGINIKPHNHLYGRMLEIKNPVSRVISGRPKKEYWVQMQIQMEVWELDECDFLETSFKEFESYDDYEKDADDTFTHSHKADGRKKGIIIMFNDGIQPVYEYMPLSIHNKKKCDEWVDNTIENADKKLSWIKNIYWYLDVYSCVLVPRNKLWFKTIYPEIKACWDTILKERETGYDHRKPKKRVKKEVVKKNISPKSIIKNLNENNDLTLLNEKPKIENNVVVLKVRTQSFDQVNS